MPKSRLQRKGSDLITVDTPLETVLELGAECDRSGRCCRHGSGIVLKEEIPRLAERLSMTPEQFREKYLDEFTNFNTTHYRLKQRKPGRESGRESRFPHGWCVFLDRNGRDCTIHEFKPLHCRATSCCSIRGEELSLWFLFNHFLNPFDEESVREYRQYVKLGGRTLPGVEERIRKQRGVMKNAKANTSHDS